MCLVLPQAANCLIQSSASCNREVRVHSVRSNELICDPSYVTITCQCTAFIKSFKTTTKGISASTTNNAGIATEAASP
jgi:hypothetical protein